MKSFLEHIVDGVDLNRLEELRTTVYVFPSRRACFHFRQALLSQFHSETFWLPTILSIEDFISHCTGKSPSSEIDLLFTLYQAYSETYLPPPKGEIDKEELPTFDKFYAWGQVLLKDFDEVDRYLVDAGQLYRNLEQLRDLEIRYQDNEEILFALKRFSEIMVNEPTTLATSFNNQWVRVSKTYQSFKKLLTQQNLCYIGMLYRDLADSLTDKSAELPFDRLVFAGFNALSKSEEIIIRQLYQSSDTEIYWDADRTFLENEAEEAGKFMRYNYKRFPPSDKVHWVIGDMVQNHKQLKIIGGVHAVGQAQVVGQLLNQLSPEEQNKCGVVLADEGLMFPVLYALPENIESPNVTMGYPTKHSHWFRLANAYMEYQLHQRGRGRSTYVETQYLRQVLSNPLIQKSVPKSKQLLDSLNPKHRWCLVDDILLNGASNILTLLLTPRDRVGDLISALVDMLMQIYQKLRLDQQLKELETEFAYHSLKHLLQLQERILKHHQQLEPKTLARLIVQAFEQARIPFSGAPTDGLQIMGFLETRALDFDTVILVSVNEGKLPRGSRHTSFIPFAVRKAFKLPTYEEQDAIYAYHFKRVLQRARQVKIVYNTEVAIDGSGEKSRFIWQLMESFPAKNITQEVYQMSLPNQGPATGLEIKKSPAVLGHMQRFLVGNGDIKSLSPTAVRHYLDCSLRFYFRYVVRLYERETETTDLHPRDFGNIVHQVFEQLYGRWEGTVVEKDRIKRLLNSNDIPEAVDQVMGEFVEKSPGSKVEGKDILHQQIIQKLIYKAVEKDLWLAPFKIKGAEMKISTDLEFDPGRKVRLEGTLDRVHLANEVVHVIDYKTGKADFTRRGSFRNDIEGYVKVHFEDPKYKYGFQSLFYGYLWSQANDDPLKLGVYPLKKVNEGIQWLYHSGIIPIQGFKEFESQLVKALHELFDESVPFTQTEDQDRCRFCAYKEICQR